MKYEYWFAAIQGLTDEKKLLLRSYMKSGKDIYYIEETMLTKLSFINEKDVERILRAKEQWNLKKEYEKLLQKQIRVIYCYEDLYPRKLLNIPDPPYALYVKGNLPDENKKSIAIVGARKCTPYGEKHACVFAQRLAEQNVQIISGLAHGIDGFAHRGALFGKGKTFAVLGNGVDICYPREHIGLYTDILENGGGILSELPPGSSPLPRHFPKRNRIISGLSEAVLVMEAKEKSGSLITADMALEQGKDVYALPGMIDNPLSAGCHHLIRQGAGILISAENMLEELKICPEKGITKKLSEIVEEKKVLESDEDLVYSTFAVCSKNANEIIDETGLPAEQVMRCLVSLEIQGYIKEISKNHYLKIK